MKNGHSLGTTQLSVCLTAVIGVVLLGVVSGCAMREPDFLATGFDSATVEKIHVLPVLDHRIDQSKKLDLDDTVRPVVKRSLRRLGYSFELHRDRSLVSTITRDALEAPTLEFIASLPPQSARWVLLLVLNDSSSKFTFGSTGNAEMSGYLFDKQIGELSWRNKELSRTGQGGLIGMILTGWMQEIAIYEAAKQMFQTFPKRKK